MLIGTEKWDPHNIDRDKENVATCNVNETMHLEGEEKIASAGGVRKVACIMMRSCLVKKGTVLNLCGTYISEKVKRKSTHFLIFSIATLPLAEVHGGEMGCRPPSP